MEALALAQGSKVINCEPSVTIAVDEECRVQVRVSVETRTNAFAIRSGEYPEDQLSVYVTARRYGSLEGEATYAESMHQLRDLCDEVCQQHVVQNVLQPLAQAISAG